MKLVRCSKCIMPSSRPDIEFVDGVCSACLAFEARKNVDWDARKKQLCDILSDAKPNGSGYDCIVPSSGGKDSHYQVHTVLELGAKPLIVTASTCQLTSIGRRNIDNLARYATTVEIVPHKGTRTRLNKLGLELVGDISWPEHSSIFTTPFRVAEHTGINLLVYGENPQREYGGPITTQDATQMTSRWVSEFGGFLGLRPSDLIDAGIPEQHMNDYRLPDDMSGIQALFLGQFIPWDSRRNAMVAQSMGMEVRVAYPGAYWVFENLDNAQTGIHDWFGYLKYGYGRACVQISVDIRNGLIERERGLELALTLDREFPDEYCGVPFESVLDHIGMTRKEFMRVADGFTNWEIFRRVVDDSNAHPMLIC